MQTIQVWNLESCLSENKLVGDKGSFGVHAVTTTPDSRRIVSGGYRTLKVWDFTSGRLERTLEGHTGLVLSVEVTPDGDRIVSRGYNFVRVWNLARGRLEYTLPKYHSSIAVTPDGHQIVSGGEGFAQPKNYNAVRVWDIVSGRQERTIVGSPDRVLSVAVTPDHRRIVSGDDDASVRIWDLASGRLERTLVGHKVFVVSVAVTPDSSRILSRSADGIVRIWDVESGNLERSLPNSDTETYIKPDILGLGWREGLEAVVTRDGRRIVLKGKDANLLIWDLESGRLESKLKSQIDSVYCFAITMDSARIIFRGEDRTLCIWDLASGQEIASWTPDPGLTITSCCTVPKDPSLFVYGDSAGVVHVLKLLEDPG
jgi:WD40 repeat protein